MKNKFCLGSVDSFEKINSSHTNRSKTKQTFSFSKASRFNNQKPTCQYNYYGSQPLNFKRKPSASGIGYGKKSDFTKCYSLSPPSSKYYIKSELQRSLSKNKGITIANGRDKIAFNSYLNKQLFTLPAPNKYNNEKSPRTKSPVYSLRQKTKMSERWKTIEPQNDNPGPGQYQNPQINYNSSYASKFSRLSYSPGKSQRFLKSDNNVPAPGKYKDISNLSSVGKYIVSSHRGGTRAKFDKFKRIHKFDEMANKASKQPGPGRYKFPSQFGQYDGDIYRQYETNQKQPAFKAMH